LNPCRWWLLSPISHFPVSPPSVAEPLPSTNSPRCDHSHFSCLISRLLTNKLQLVFAPSPHRLIHLPVPIHIAERLHKVTARNERFYVMKVCSRVVSASIESMLAQARVTDAQRQLRCSQTTSYLKYLAFINQWWTLPAHVCQSWRQVIFESPHHLNLQIHCTHGTPVKKHLGIWPAFPIVINYYRVKARPRDQDNILSALGHPDRVCFHQEKPSAIISIIYRKLSRLLNYRGLFSPHDKLSIILR
jgi:hypothetical protein